MKAWSPNHWITREFPKCQILRELLYIYTFMSHMGLPCGSDGKGSACNAGCLGLIPVLRRFPGGGHGNPLQYSCLEESHGQRSLAGSSPWCCKETDMTE